MLGRVGCGMIVLNWVLQEDLMEKIPFEETNKGWSWGGSHLAMWGRTFQAEGMSVQRL